MRHHLVFAAIASAVLLVVQSGSPRAASAMPDWAYAIPQPPPAAPAAPPAPDRSTKTLPGTTLSFTRQQISDGFGPADWFPGDHPPMPEIVAHGKRPDVRACGLCHYPNGKGRQENAGVAGLPVVLFHPDDERFQERRAQERRIAEGEHQRDDRAIAKAMTAEEIKATAEYFGAIAWTPWIQGGRNRDGAEDGQPRRHLGAGRRRREASRSARASSKCPRTRSAPRCCAIRGRDSSRMRRSAASKRARRW